MKPFLHCSGVVGIALVTLFTIAPAAGATGITLGSFGSVNTNPGFSNTALEYLGSSAYQVNGGVLSAPGGATSVGGPGTQNLQVTSTWEQAIGNSNWVSFQSSGPAGPASPANDYYYYSSAFNAPAGQYTGSLSVLADDTAEIFLDGRLIAGFASIANDAHCSLDGNGPTCGYYGSTSAEWTVPLDVTLDSANTLVIVDAQTGGGPAGLDFLGSLTSAGPEQETQRVATPEPASLLLLGTGLAVLAFTVICKGRLA